ncbi:tripartite tricarboxylate transporter TctB family protein [Georgenia sp. AZ-5]|uniref:tripartite tricarboxylate transporter TctB family protein n=1 Tax=Georgenia sp. AZ-5 TaxID=3367526 RepID=UPI00375464BA
MNEIDGGRRSMETASPDLATAGAGTEQKESRHASAITAEAAPAGIEGTVSAVLFALSCLVGAGAAAVVALDFAGRAGLAPLIVAVPTAALAAVVLIQEITRWRSGRRRTARRRLIENPYAWISTYAAAFYLLGALGALVLFSTSLMRWRGHQPWRMTLIVTVGTAVAFFVATEVLLEESLYRGVFLEQLR